MSNVAIVYWSGTGNTEAMANAVAEGVTEKGAEASTFTASDFSADKVAEFDAIAFGCPAMGAEVLEEGEMEPFMAELDSQIAGKTIALFGSYGWGDGEWMRTWEEDCASAGIRLAADSVTCCEAPDDEALSACQALGKKLAE